MMNYRERSLGKTRRDDVAKCKQTVPSSFHFAIKYSLSRFNSLRQIYWRVELSPLLLKFVDKQCRAFSSKLFFGETLREFGRKISHGFSPISIFMVTVAALLFNANHWVIQKPDSWLERFPSNNAITWVHRWNFMKLVSISYPNHSSVIKIISLNMWVWEKSDNLWDSKDR